MIFTLLFEKIDFSSTETVISKGEVLYHGTLGSFDVRDIKVGAYDGIFWTSDNPLIARSYIPRSGSYLSTSYQQILDSDDLAGVRKSLGITPSVKRRAVELSAKGYNDYVAAQKEVERYAKRYKEKADELDDDFFDLWKSAEDRVQASQANWVTYDSLMKRFIVAKMKNFGYTTTDAHYPHYKIIRGKGGDLLPADTYESGRLIQVTCNRDFRFYNYAYGVEGDLMDVDHRKLNLFRKVESRGYDGIIINDFAQTERFGNYGHYGIGFFKNSIRDLSTKQIANQTHPRDNEWDY